MKFIRAKPKDITGSSFSGYIETTYEHLVSCLDKPNDRMVDEKWKSGDGKVRVEWSFKTKYKKPTVITIYDYKEIIPVNEVTMWHIGSKGNVKMINEFFKEKGLSRKSETREK
jgi:hypothetical protein